MNKLELGGWSSKWIWSNCWHHDSSSIIGHNLSLQTFDLHHKLIVQRFFNPMQSQVSTLQPWPSRYVKLSKSFCHSRLWNLDMVEGSCKYNLLLLQTYNKWVVSLFFKLITWFSSLAKNLLGVNYWRWFVGCIQFLFFILWVWNVNMC
jgi:hypothetical protein